MWYIPPQMRALWLILFLASVADSATPVNWTHYPKVKEWDFETRPSTHANIDAEIIRRWIAPDQSMRSVDRAKLATRSIAAFTRDPYLRAVLMRDVLDAIGELDRNFEALDRPATNGVIFLGRYINSDTRFALAISFETGLFYRGSYYCSLDIGSLYAADFSDKSQWTLVE